MAPTHKRQDSICSVVSSDRDLPSTNQPIFYPTNSVYVEKELAQKIEKQMTKPSPAMSYAGQTTKEK